MKYENNGPACCVRSWDCLPSVSLPGHVDGIALFQPPSHSNVVFQVCRDGTCRLYRAPTAWEGIVEHGTALEDRIVKLQTTHALTNHVHTYLVKKVSGIAENTLGLQICNLDMDPT